MDSRHDTTQLVEDVDYAGYAEVLGLQGITVDKPEQVADRPVVLDVHTAPTCHHFRRTFLSPKPRGS